MALRKQCARFRLPGLPGLPSKCYHFRMFIFILLNLNADDISAVNECE